MTFATAQFDIQGHRGCRGLMPENTIAAFLKAVDLGVTTLEMDVVITADNQVLVSHDPYISHEICRAPGGKPIAASESKSHNIYQMTAAGAQEYNCGETVHRRFPEQVKLRAVKPLLSEVIDAVESYVALNNLKPVWYNIETKCTPSGDGIYHPGPAAFTDLVMEVVEIKKITQRIMIQSFDIRTLQHLKKINRPVQLVLLVENRKGVEHNLSRLGFKPDVYSCHYKLLSKNDIILLHEMGIRVIPWTVNSVKTMANLIRKGVDGIITDYPDRLIKLLR